MRPSVAVIVIVPPNVGACANEGVQIDIHNSNSSGSISSDNISINSGGDGDLHEWLQRQADKTDILVVDDLFEGARMPSTLPNAVGLCAVLRAFNKLNADTVPGPHSLSNNNNNNEKTVLLDRLQAVSDLVLRPRTGILVVARALARVSGANLLDVLAGRRLSMYHAFVRKQPELARDLSVDPQRDAALEGGLVLPCETGLHSVEGVVTLFDFRSAYPNVGAVALQQQAPALSSAFADLLKLREKYRQQNNEAASLACKLFTNSIFYGCLGHARGQHSNRRLANIITARVRCALAAVRKHLVNAGARVLGGHTDGILVMHEKGEAPALLLALNALEQCKGNGLCMKIERQFRGPRFFVCNRVAYAGVCARTGEIVSKGLANSITRPLCVQRVFERDFLRPLLQQCPSLRDLLRTCRRALPLEASLSALTCRRELRRSSNRTGNRAMLCTVTVAPNRHLGVREAERALASGAVVVDWPWYQTHHLDPLLQQCARALSLGTNMSEERRKQFDLQAHKRFEALTRQDNGINHVTKEEMTGEINEEN